MQGSPNDGLIGKYIFPKNDAINLHIQNHGMITGCYKFKKRYWCIINETYRIPLSTLHEYNFYDEVQYKLIIGK